MVSPEKISMDRFKNLPEGTLAELIDNFLYMSPSPAFNHQDVLLNIASECKRQLKGQAKVVVAPFDIYLDSVSNAVQPDIVILLNENSSSFDKSGHFHGVPDAIVEILSPSNKDHDLVRKKALYEKFAVKEYWIVNPVNKTALIYKLDKEKFIVDSFGENRITSTVLRIIVNFE